MTAPKVTTTTASGWVRRHSIARPGRRPRAQGHGRPHDVVARVTSSTATHDDHDEQRQSRHTRAGRVRRTRLRPQPSQRSGDHGPSVGTAVAPCRIGRKDQVRPRRSGRELRASAADVARRPAAATIGATAAPAPGGTRCCRRRCTDSAGSRPAVPGPSSRPGSCSPRSWSGASGAFGAKLEDSFRVPGLDSQQANDLLAGRGLGPGRRDRAGGRARPPTAATLRRRRAARSR